MSRSTAASSQAPSREVLTNLLKELDSEERGVAEARAAMARYGALLRHLTAEREHIAAAMREREAYELLVQEGD